MTGAVFLAINLLVLSMFFWSRGGQTTVVRFEAQGDNFAAYVDGELKVQAELAAPIQGGLILTVESTENIPSLPKPRGIDHVRVTDLTNGEVLFEDDFTSGVAGAWTEDSEYSNGDRRLSIANVSWGDIEVEVRYNNITGAAIVLRDDGKGTSVVYSFRPFQHYDNGISLIEDGESVTRVAGERLEVSRVETMKSLVAMTLNSYLSILLLLILGFIVVTIVHVSFPPSVKLSLPNVPTAPLWYAGACAVVVFAFAATLFLNIVYGSSIPHVPDSVAYIFQAKVFASGHLSSPPPPVADAFEFFYPSFFVVVNDRWVSVYPFGHPLLLAVGVRLGAVWLVPPLLGAASVALVFVIGRTIYHARVGLLAALLLASSPFFLMTASNFMSHNTAAFYLLAALLCVAIIDRRPLLYGVAAGLFFGLLFNTRPLAAMSLIVPFGVFLLAPALQSGRKRPAFTSIGGFLAGGLVMLGAYGLYNYGAVGDAFGGALQIRGEFDQAIGFGGSHSVDLGIQNEQTQLAALLLVLHGWPQYVGLMFVLLPFILGTRKRWDWFLLSCAVFLIGSYALFATSGIMHGPRFWYPAAPILMLLAARGADRAAEVLAAGASSVGAILNRGSSHRPKWAGILVVYALVLVLVSFSLHGWLLSKDTGWEFVFVPQNATSLQGFNNINDGLVRLIEDADLDNALVLVKKCQPWRCFGSVFWMNSPSLDGNVVIAEDLDRRMLELYQAYPERNVYLADFGSTRFPETASLVPIDESQTPRTWPAPTPTPSFDGGRDPIVSNVETPLENSGVLYNVRTARHAYSDRIVFDFRDVLPSYRVEYVSAPLVYCGSDRPVNLTGDAFLQVRFASATAEPQELQTLTPHYTSLREGTIICDFEGNLTWLFGLSAEVDFAVDHSEQLFRVTIDVALP